MIEQLEDGDQVARLGAALDRERALPRRGEHQVDPERRRVRRT